MDNKFNSNMNTTATYSNQVVKVHIFSATQGWALISGYIKDGVKTAMRKPVPLSEIKKIHLA